MNYVLRNFRLGLRTAVQHLTDDPILLALQISRRLPDSIVGPFAKSIRAVSGGETVLAPSLVSFMHLGEHEEVERRIELALERGMSPVQAARLADFAVCINRLDLADRALELCDSSDAASAAKARRLWHAGDLTAAVAAISGQSRRQRNLRTRLGGELAVLKGAVPSLPRQSFSPLPNKVLHLITNSLPHTGSGYAQRTHSMLLAQRDQGWEVHAVTRLGYPVQVGKFFAKPQDVVDGITYQRLIPSVLGSSLAERLQQQAEELLRIAMAFRPSVLHTTTHFVNGIVVKAVAEALGIPWVYEVRGQLADTWASTRSSSALASEKYQLFKRAEAMVMLSADVVVTLGQEMRSKIVAEGVSARRVIIAPNAVGGDYERVPMGMAQARLELGLDTEAFFVGTVSSLVDYEGIDDLIRAFDLLAADHPALHLLIVGDGVSLPGLRAQALRSPWNTRIVFTGRVQRSRAIRYHQALDVFVVPRKNMAVTRSVTPLKPVEAMASSKPVLASRLPALEEILEDQKSGLLFEASDIHDLASKLEILIRSSGLRNEIGVEARTRVLATRTWKKNANVIGDAYAMISEKIK
ncbi:glycosyltransferase family 4 protein [Pseudarthrobacter sp. PS3-L1]|uniref:glycosyltransferase family 4 protein n=1 Tax=Pseudarthrobacter sp. PS3-L1 TaxID=3046207 RepID=UPI0024BA0937|nr:glycosyltransferase family 4 protein [Pseudarthrobacter sp. PS3-L1]MDJ0321740.1 glycosyltransferase family 4 protein [Pseudarthrobacter sp. PS3-L1]